MKSLDQIAAQLHGYDPHALPVGKVHEFLAALVAPVSQSERIALSNALGRVLSHDVIAPISVPPHDNAAMDGFALRGADLQTDCASVLKMVGSALAGKPWQGTIGPGECIKIMTGAPMPKELDTVAPLELCRVLNHHIEIAPGLLQAGDHRRLKGEDLTQGTAALQRGDRLTPAAIGLLASLNIGDIEVFRLLKIAYFSTGDEILSLGEAPRAGAIYDSNRHTVSSLIAQWGHEFIDMGVVRDEPAALESAFRHAARQADAVITSGGVSTGEADFTKVMMKKLGDVAFWRIAMRPGRPMAVGRIQARLPSGADSAFSDNDCILFGLPGNPVATMVTMLVFVRCALARMRGLRPALIEPLYLQAHCTEALRKKAGRTEYQRGFVWRGPDGSLQVRTTGSNQGSGVLSSMVQANGLIVLHHEQGPVRIGDLVDVMMFESTM